MGHCWRRGETALGTCLPRGCAPLHAQPPGGVGRQTDRQPYPWTSTRGTTWQLQLVDSVVLQQISPPCMSENTITEQGPVWAVQRHGRAHQLTPLLTAASRTGGGTLTVDIFILELSIARKVRLDSQYNVISVTVTGQTNAGQIIRCRGCSKVVFCIVYLPSSSRAQSQKIGDSHGDATGSW